MKNRNGILNNASTMNNNCISLLFSNVSNPQRQLDLNLHSGLNSTAGACEKFSENGLFFVVAGDFFMSRSFGLGFDVNTQSNGFKPLFDYNRIPPPDGALYNITRFEDYINGELFFDPAALIELPLIKEKTNPLYYNYNAGITNSLGPIKPKKTPSAFAPDRPPSVEDKNDEKVEEKDVCEDQYVKVKKRLQDGLPVHRGDVRI